MNGKYFIGSKALSANTYKAYEPITQVVLWVDNNNCYVAGTDAGTVLEADCPYANQEMADALLDSMSGYVYEPLEAEGARLSPVAELGDGITVNGVYSQLAYQNIRFSTGEVMDVAAPGGGEVLHEYQVEGELTKDFEHKLAETHSEIIKTAEEIRLEVENEIEGLSSSISVQIDSIESTVQGQNGQISQIQQTVDSVSSTVSGLDNQVSSIEQYVDSITLSVSNGSTSSTISLQAGSATISSQTISMNGLVTFTGLESGTTTINGACIKTGLIDADRLNLTGSITFGDLSSTVQNDINDAYTMAQNAQWDAQDAVSTVSGWTYSGTTYIDGSKIMAGTVMASELQGGVIDILDSGEDIAGSFTVTPASSSDAAIELQSYGALRLLANDGAVYIQNGNNDGIEFNDGMLSIGSDIVPSNDGLYLLGAEFLEWVAVYANRVVQSNSMVYGGGPSVASDRQAKEEINYNISKYDELFDALRPVSFKYINGTSGRTHLGLIAQDVEDSMTAVGISSQDFAGLVKDPAYDKEGQVIDGTYNYYLRYDEFLPMCIQRIKQLEARIMALEATA